MDTLGLVHILCRFTYSHTISMDNIYTDNTKQYCNVHAATLRFDEASVHFFFVSEGQYVRYLG